MAVGVDRRAKKVASRSGHSLLLQPVGGAMSFTPLTQTSEIAYPIPESTIFQDPDDHSDYDPANLDHTAGPPPSLHVHKKRRHSRDKIATALRRSSSTPHMRNLALGNTGDLSPSDKRRNKLGYHRTSVACGHCRRRKIRCLVAQDEPTGRCANCIRLKKECNFYPVDQAPENPRLQANSGQDTTSAAPASSTTSSPQQASSLSADKVEDFRPSFSPAVQPSPSHSYGLSAESDMEPHRLPQANTLHMPQPSYGYPQPINTEWPPATAFLPSSSVAESPSSSSGYTFSGGHTPATMSSTSTMSYGAHPEGHNWPPTPSFQPPTRSMSYGNIEGLPQHFSSQGLGIQHDYPRRPSPYHYPGTIDTNPSTHSTLGCNTSAPLSAPILSGHHQYNYPPPWPSYSNGPATPAQDRSMSGQWYGEAGQLDQLHEETVPVTFSQHALPQFYSGT